MTPWASEMELVVKNLPANAADTGDPDWDDTLDEGMATHSGILVLRIPWTEEPVGCSPWGLKVSDMTEAIQLTHVHEMTLVLYPDCEEKFWKAPITVLGDNQGNRSESTMTTLHRLPYLSSQYLLLQKCLHLPAPVSTSDSCRWRACTMFLMSQEGLMEPVLIHEQTRRSAALPSSLASKSSSPWWHTFMVRRNGK